MTLELHFHPLASYCHKVLIALYESEIAFTPRLLDLADPAAAAAHVALWPVGKMPLLVDAGRVVPESTIILEHLATTIPRASWLLPAEPEAALETRLRDRFFDLYVHTPMQKIVTDRLRPASSRDPYGVDEARKQLGVAYAMIERDLAGRSWAAGERFTMADCAAAPALFYADLVAPLGGDHPRAREYLERLKGRPSYARVLREAEPYFGHFPKE
ncbi:MAG: glutathione S-transferase family protein [Sandaracinus sp.]|nr:glutathione S-transferase family protein [Sandaracinaceae bacterium]